MNKRNHIFVILKYNLQRSSIRIWFALER
jgi:hypothetical protein